MILSKILIGNFGRYYVYIEDMMATLEKWGISIDDLLSDDDEE